LVWSRRRVARVWRVTGGEGGAGSIVENERCVMECGTLGVWEQAVGQQQGGRGEEDEAILFGHVLLHVFCTHTYGICAVHWRRRERGDRREERWKRMRTLCCCRRRVEELRRGEG